jgi:DNA-binding MarR family transcriptional regulator
MTNGIDRVIISVSKSKIKKAALKRLSRTMTTAQKISAKTDFRASHVTVALRNLKKSKAVRLINPYDKNPDIYEITEIGRRVLRNLNNFTRKKKSKVFRRSGKRRAIS